MAEVTGLKTIAGMALFLLVFAVLAAFAPGVDPSWGVAVGVLFLVFSWVHGAQNRDVTERSRRNRHRRRR